MIKELLLTTMLANPLNNGGYPLNSYSYSNIGCFKNSTLLKYVEATTSLELAVNGDISVYTNISISSNISTGVQNNPNLTSTSVCSFTFNDNLGFYLQDLSYIDISYNVDVDGDIVEIWGHILYEQYGGREREFTYNIFAFEMSDYLSGVRQWINTGSTAISLYDVGSVYQSGYNDRYNSVDDTEQRMDSIWNILERGIQAVLNVLSIDLLPGIPLYVCIAVPVLFALLMWFIKMGAS